ncbi:MAG: NAD(P)/FAD-dependent oxidoreductase [Candidatus Bathyarchaeia archaeon]
MICDVLVIGAGLLGLSSAYHIQRGNPGKRIVVIEMNPGPGQGNTAKSNACFRNVFTSETNYLLSNSTIDWFKHLQRDGDDIYLSWIGYLWLYSERQYSELEGAFRAMEARGIDFSVLNREEVREKIPQLSVDKCYGDGVLGELEPVDLAVLGEKCGSLDSDALCRAYESRLEALGGEIHYSTKAKRLMLEPEIELGIPGEPFVWQEAHIKGAETERGEIEAETTVVATGAWSEGLMNPIGLDPFMRAKKRQIFVFKDPRLEGLFDVEGLNSLGVLPMTILPMGGIHFKPQLGERSIWLGCADELGREFQFEPEPEPEMSYYTENVYYILREYFPCFSDVRPINMWAGHYAINSFDGIPLVEKSPGLIYVGAASGSGVMKCDALGRIASALYGGEEYAELYGGAQFKVSDIGIAKRNVEKEGFIL